jgi:hypothetical protein
MHPPPPSPHLPHPCCSPFTLRNIPLVVSHPLPRTPAPPPLPPPRHHQPAPWTSLVHPCPQVTGNVVRDCLTPQVLEQAGIDAVHSVASPLPHFPEGTTATEVLGTNVHAVMRLLDAALHTGGVVTPEGKPHLVVLVRVEWLEDAGGIQGGGDAGSTPSATSGTVVAGSGLGSGGGGGAGAGSVAGSADASAGVSASSTPLSPAGRALGALGGTITTGTPTAHHHRGATLYLADLSGTQDLEACGPGPVGLGQRQREQERVEFRSGVRTNANLVGVGSD